LNLNIRTKKGVVRRCGFDFNEEWVEVPISKLKYHQIESLKSDILLEVEENIEQLVLEQNTHFQEIIEQEGYV
jgi:hypothetical protein